MLLSIDDDSSDSECVEFLLSSSSSSESDADHRKKKCRVENYLDVVENYTELQFKQHFRVKRIVAENIISKNLNI